MMKTQLRSHAALGVSVLATAILVACGGGDDVTSAPPENPKGPLPPVPENIAIAPKLECSMAGIGATALTADAAVTVLDVSSATTGAAAIDKPYCLVKVKVDPQVNIWVALPTESWNGRFRSEGGGGYAGSVGVAVDSVRQGFVGVMTDTGHTGGSGDFGMLSPGVANTQLQVDFAYRSEHLMAVVGKQLTKAFYGQDPVRSYWYGCSTGGRQGLRMAQQFPDDYDAILAGAPAINWDRFQAYQIWPQVAMRMETGAVVSNAKKALATSRAVAACDVQDGVVDGVLDDPRKCTYDPRLDAEITKASCAAGDNTCLSPSEANAIQKIWGGARDRGGNLLWTGLQRGTDLGSLAGPTPFSIAVAQPRYWVYLDPSWDWTTLTYDNYGDFFQKTRDMVGPLMASNDPDLSAFRQRGGKLVMYHGWADPLIMPEGTVDYYNAVQQKMGTTDFVKLYMVPGMGHCSGGSGPNSFGQGNSTAVPQTPDRDVFRALMAWSEKDAEPGAITATRFTGNNASRPVDRTRPLCSYPQVARYNGSGSTDDAVNFSCVNP